MKGCKWILLFTIFSFVASTPTFAQKTEPLGEEQQPLTDTGEETATRPAEKDWEVHIAPYMWTMMMDGTMTVRGRSMNVSTDMSDVFDTVLNKMDAMYQIHFEAFKRNWGFLADFNYMRLEDKGNVGPLELKMTNETSIIELAGLYRFGRWQLGESGRNSVSLDGLAGVRSWSMRAEINVSPGPNIIQGRDWVDPMVGVRSVFDLGEKHKISFRGDVGGFGVGSDLSWNLVGLYGFNFAKHGTLFIGYRGMYVNYHEGSGTSRFQYKMTTHGPVLGLDIHF